MGGNILNAGFDYLSKLINAGDLANDLKRLFE
jgi:hypothetical protein